MGLLGFLIFWDGGSSCSSSFKLIILALDLRPIFHCPFYCCFVTRSYHNWAKQRSIIEETKLSKSREFLQAFVCHKLRTVARLFYVRSYRRICWWNLSGFRVRGFEQSFFGGKIKIFLCPWHSWLVQSSCPKT